MISKKYFLLAALASFSLTLGACSTKQPTPNPSSGSGHDDTSVVTSDTESESSESESSSEEKTITQIIVKENTVPTNFVVGDAFSVIGGRLQIRYSDSTRDEIDMTLSMVENAPDMSVSHENYEVNVVYEGARTSYFINVIAEDTRQSVTIGVEYEYNDGPRTEMVDNLIFFVGKNYKFHYGCYPNEAYDSLGVKYYEVGDETPIAKPDQVGNYIYQVYIAEGDDTYKPVSVEYHYSIVEAVVENFELNRTNGPTLSEVATSLSEEVNGMTINYKNVKSASEGLLTLVKECPADEKPNYDDNYVEIASPVSLTGALNVEFTGQDNYLYVYGSYDLEHYFLVDTLTRAKNSTTRANDYCFIRLVAAPLGHNDVTINSINYAYEVDGVSGLTVARAEKGDRFNYVSSSEDNAYFHRRTEEVFDERYSNKSIGIRLKECSVRVDLGTTLTPEEVKYYQVSFKVCPTSDAVFHQAKDDATEVSEIGVYVKSVLGTSSVGTHKKVVTINHDLVWTDVTVDLITLFPDNISEMDAFHVWLNRYCASGAVVFDDFRITQKSNYPVPYALTSLSVSGMTTEYTKNATFNFDGVITAHYSDYYSEVIANDDPNVTISSPNMASSGTKTITISYTRDGVTKSVQFTITVSASGNPKDEEILPIVAEENDLAKTSNQYNSGREYDCGKTRENTETTYGNSTSSLDVYNLKIDADCYINLKLPQALVKNSIHVKFFAKNLPSPVYVQLMDTADLSDKDANLQRAYVNADQVGASKPKTSVTTDQDATFHFTATDAGNDWTMYEYDFYAANVTNGVNYFRLSTSVKLSANTTFVIDGLEVY